MASYQIKGNKIYKNGIEIKNANSNIKDCTIGIFVALLVGLMFGIFGGGACYFSFEDYRVYSNIEYEVVEVTAFNYASYESNTSKGTRTVFYTQYVGYYNNEYCVFDKAYRQPIGKTDIVHIYYKNLNAYTFGKASVEWSLFLFGFLFLSMGFLSIFFVCKDTIPIIKELKRQKRVETNTNYSENNKKYNRYHSFIKQADLEDIDLLKQVIKEREEELEKLDLQSKY